MRVLVLDESAADRVALQRAIEASGLEVELVEATSLTAAREALATGPEVAAIVTDHRLVDGAAIDLLAELRQNGSEPPVVVLTAQGDERVAVDLMKAGAADYLLKSELSPRRIRKVLRSVVQVADAERRAKEAREAEHRLLHELARERERLQRALAERDEVLAILSHDLRSPLSNVSMALACLAEELTPVERERYAVLGTRAVERALQLIEDLLDVTRIEQGGLSIELRDVDAAQLATEAVDAMRLAAERQRVDLVLELDTKLGRARADRARIAQVFQNLLSNALRFTPPESAIRVRARRADGAVYYEVHDEGPGVPPGATDRLFERFWQARRSDRSGAGLGLAIVKGIVEAHGGTVALAPSERGARFVFSLPVHSA